MPQEQPTAVVSAASFGPVISPGSIAACFGSFVTQDSRSFSASNVPLPDLLGGVRIRVNGQIAGLFYASPTQINFLVPDNAGEGLQRVEIFGVDGSRKEVQAPISRVAPSIFTALSDGHGTAAAVTTFDGIRYENAANTDGSAREIAPGTPGRQNILVLFGTGWRSGTPTEIRVKINNIPSKVLYAGKTNDYVGLDQVNVLLPWQLSGSGNVEVLITGAGRTSNIVNIKIGGPKITLPAADLAFNQQITSDLTANDPIQPTTFEAGRIRYFDAYKFKVTGFNTGISIDLRSSQFDASINLFRVVGNDLVPVAADDFTGGFGDGKIENRNALLLTVIRQPGDYVAYATASDDNSEGTGRYTLLLKTVEITPLEYSFDTILSDIRPSDVQTSAGDYMKLYSFRGTQGQRVRITMRSNSFDSFLFLYKNDGLYLMSDDQSAGGNDARIEYVLPTDGDYLIFATPFTPGITGPFSINLSLAN